MKKKVSVIIATFNGEKFILEQLQSIHRQSYKVEEVLVCDDGSIDKTGEIVSSFIKQNKLDNWKLIKNKTSLGVTKNFLYGGKKSEGDIIFFSDQDDIWHKDKVEKMLVTLDEHSDLEVLTCRYLLIDGNGKLIKRRLFFQGIKREDGFEYITFEKQVRNNRCGGLCLCMKRSALYKYSEIILNEKLSHDLPFGLFASINGKYGILWEKLVYYRIHNTNISSPKMTVRERINNIDFQIKGREGRLELLKTCEKYYGSKLGSNQYNLLEDVIKLMEEDIRALKSRDVFVLIKHMFSRNPMYNKKISALNVMCCVFSR